MHKFTACVLMVGLVFMLAGCKAAPPGTTSESTDASRQQESSAAGDTEIGEIVKQELNISIDFSKYVMETEMPLADMKGEEIDTMIAELRKIDATFDPSSYRARIHNYTPTGDSITVTFHCYIGDDIATNKAYSFSADDGIITKLSYVPREVPASGSAEEQKLIERVNRFKSELQIDDGDETNIVEVEESYNYRCETGELTYVRIVYRQVLNGCIVDDFVEIPIE